MRKDIDKLSWALVGVLALAVVLELLPFGVVLEFAVSPTETARETYSYFSMLPLGYADFGPFFTAILTCVMLGASVVTVFQKADELLIGLALLAALAFFTSLFALIYAFPGISVIGVLITALMAAEFVLSILCKKSGRL